MQSELDALMVVIVDVIVHARLEFIKAVKRCKTEVLGLEGAKEALDHRVVKAVAPAAHGQIGGQGEK